MAIPALPAAGGSPPSSSHHSNTSTNPAVAPILAAAAAVVVLALVIPVPAQSRRKNSPVSAIGNATVFVAVASNAFANVFVVASIVFAFAVQMLMMDAQVLMAH